MNVQFDSANGAAIARLSGEIDISNIVPIQEAVAAEFSNAAAALVLDLSNVTYLDSAGVRLLFQLESRLDTRQLQLIIVVPLGSNLMRTLEAAGAVAALSIVSTLPDALAAVEST